VRAEVGRFYRFEYTFRVEPMLDTSVTGSSYGWLENTSATYNDPYEFTTEVVGEVLECEWGDKWLLTAKVRLHPSKEIVRVDAKRLTKPLHPLEVLAMQVR
jgi:hypothetical protein